MKQRVLKKELIALLKSGQAHASPRKSLEGVSSELRSRRPAVDIPSVYEELEHMRLAQEDILRYTLDPSWQSPPWPEGYWPSKSKNDAGQDWEHCLGGFFSDMEELTAWILSTEVDLLSEIPHGEGRTYLREILLIADHNAYHCGKVLQTRKLLGDWNPEDGAGD